MLARSHGDVIRLWPSAAAFGRAIGVREDNARRMMITGIPEKHFNSVIAALAAAGFPPMTYADLTALKQRREGAHQHHGEKQEG